MDDTIVFNQHKNAMEELELHHNDQRFLLNGYKDHRKFRNPIRLGEKNEE